MGSYCRLVQHRQLPFRAERLSRCLKRPTEIASTHFVWHFIVGKPWDSTTIMRKKPKPNKPTQQSKQVIQPSHPIIQANPGGNGFVFVGQQPG